VALSLRRHKYSETRLVNISVFMFFFSVHRLAELLEQNSLSPTKLTADIYVLPWRAIDDPKAQLRKIRLYSRKVDPKTRKRRNLGTFKTRAAAENHERAVQYFKRRG
jgi:hypothetical protein